MGKAKVLKDSPTETIKKTKVEILEVSEDGLTVKKKTKYGMIVIEKSHDTIAQEISNKTSLEKENILKVMDTFVNIQLEHLNVDYV